MSNPNPFEKKWLPEDVSGDVWSGETLPLAGGSSVEDGTESLVDFSAAEGAIGPIRDSSNPQRDVRVYVKHSEGWAAHIKQDWLKEYCYSQNPGEEYYHLLICGEIYLQRGTEKFCLSCALRHGHATLERMHWQRSGARPSEEKA